MTALVLEWRCDDAVRVGWVPHPAGPAIPAAIVGPPGTGSGGGGGEPAIDAGTTAQYWRGDKSWQTLDKAAVGLGNVDNTSDATKPVSTAQASAIAARQPLATVLTNTTASFTTAQETKLAGIATGATANDTDANLKARANHTGTQAVGTIAGNWPVAQLNGGTGASSTTFWRGDGTWATPAGGGGSSEPGYASGRRHALLASAIFTPTSGSTLTAGSLYLKPAYIRSSVTISALYAEIVTAVASSNFQIGIYATDATSLMPTGAPIYNSGNISAAAAGVVGVTGLSASLTPGWYWVGWMGSGAIAARTSGNDGVVVRYCGYSTGNLASHLVKTGTFGTWPTLTGSFSGDSFSDAESSSRCAVIWAVP